MKKQFLHVILLFTFAFAFGHELKTDEQGTASIPKPLTNTLFQNYPNPFQGSTQIKFEILEDARVSLVVYNILGNEVAVLIDDELSAGSYQVEWNADRLPKGNYFCKLTAGDFQSVKKMTLR